MDLYEIATQLTLQAIEKDYVHEDGENSAERIAKTFDVILKGVNQSIWDINNL